MAKAPHITGTPQAVARRVLAGLAVAALAGCAPSGPRPETVRVVGSSTIFPFAAKAAERYSARTGVSVVVEQTGSGGGQKLFCSGDPSIDATTSSRAQKPSEAALCAANGVAPVLEVRLGHDGIVLARGADAAPLSLDRRDLYAALARDLPAGGADCSLVPNPHRLWSDVDGRLPAEPIEVHGPPPTSGTRDAFVETAMEAGARRHPCLARLEAADPDAFRARAHALREDGRWVDAGENDEAMIRTLTNSPAALGVFGFSFLDRNADRVRAVPVDGVLPSPRTIRNGDYPVVRDLYLYLRADADPMLAGRVGYAEEFTSDEAAGPGGYLEAIGLIPLSGPARAEVQAALAPLAEVSPP